MVSVSNSLVPALLLGILVQFININVTTTVINYSINSSLSLGCQSIWVSVGLIKLVDEFMIFPLLLNTLTIILVAKWRLVLCGILMLLIRSLFVRVWITTTEMVAIKVMHVLLLHLLLLPSRNHRRCVVLAHIHIVALGNRNSGLLLNEMSIRIFFNSYSRLTRCLLHNRQKWISILSLFWLRRLKLKRFFQMRNFFKF